MLLALEMRRREKPLGGTRGEGCHWWRRLGTGAGRGERCRCSKGFELARKVDAGGLSEGWAATEASCCPCIAALIHEAFGDVAGGIECARFRIGDTLIARGDPSDRLVLQIETIDAVSDAGLDTATVSGDSSWFKTLQTCFAPVFFFLFLLRNAMS